MNLWVDIKFSNLISVQLENFTIKQQNPYLANFRCPLCMDSKKNKKKARGFLYTKGTALFYKCHNCSAGTSFGKLLKDLNSELYKQYVMERYSQGLDIGNAPKPHSKPDFAFSQPVFKEKSLLDSLLDRLDSLPDDNIAVKYCRTRKIPEAKFSELYYIDDVRKIEQLSAKYKDKMVGSEPKLVLPFYSRHGKLVGVTCRALGAETLRYIAIRIDDTQPMIYNLDRVDLTETVYCVEGPIDSLFIPNSIAIGSSDMKKIEPYIPKHKAVLIVDNQPRNSELLRIMKRAAKDDWSIVVWPDTVEEKDINEMILSGRTSTDVLDLINKNTYSGLSLILKLNTWNKCNDGIDG